MSDGNNIDDDVKSQVQSHAKASEQENKIVSQMKQPITEKEELVQDKPNISNVTIGDRIW